MTPREAIAMAPIALTDRKLAHEAEKDEFADAIAKLNEREAPARDLQFLQDDEPIRPWAMSTERVVFWPEGWDFLNLVDVPQSVGERIVVTVALAALTFLYVAGYLGVLMP
jgi:hypothetical protein